MADKLPVKLGQVYKLEWTVPDVAVVNAFVNPDGTSIDFPDPDPTPAGETASRIEITVKKGPDEAHLTPDPFRKNRTPPFMSKKIVKTRKGEQTVKVFSATFEARQEGVFEFTVAGGPDGKSKTQTMFVRRTYRTIQEVIDDPAAVRRHAVLASIAEFFPAFNTWTKDPSRGSQGKKKGQDTGIVGQGPWVSSYEFDGRGTDTSCTSVNPFMMGTKHTKNTSGKWSFNAGPAVGGNPAWVFCDKDHLPSVGDTYIVLNPFTAKQYGHVGIVLHIPPNGHGLWVMADGGQGGRPDQLAILVPRWGLMAS
ncbi:MAG: hypothetical protein KDK70_31290, partial [Myxococcales bacterium]|nr:hypothetical protein [Myxococcales bacterium]